MKSENIPVAALIGCDAPSSVCTSLASLGFDLHILARDERLSKPVSSHADMLMFPIEDRIYTSKLYYEKAQDIFEMLAARGYEIIPLDVKISEKYPNDISFNISVLGKYVFAKLDSIPQRILSDLSSMGYRLCPVRQGYAKCSSLAVGGNSMITADVGLFDAARTCGADVQMISNPQGAIKILQYDRGFIGGVAGVFADNVFFCGDILLHPEGKAIVDFLKSKGLSATSLSSEPLFDVGGIFFFPARA